MSQSNTEVVGNTGSTVPPIDYTGRNGYTAEMVSVKKIPSVKGTYLHQICRDCSLVYFVSNYVICYKCELISKVLVINPYLQGNVLIHFLRQKLRIETK